MKYISNIVKLWRECRRAHISFSAALIRHLIYRARGALIVTGPGTEIYGLRNIRVNEILSVGLSSSGMMGKSDKTVLNVHGELRVTGKFTLFKGCRVFVDKGGALLFKSGFINFNTNIFCRNSIIIGDDAVISWGCQILDDDFHSVSYSGKISSRLSGIYIGNHVWIGCNSVILKGTHIADGCVIAAGSLVRGRFETPNSLIAGNPAVVIRENVSWEH